MLKFDDCTMALVTVLLAVGCATPSDEASSNTSATPPMATSQPDKSVSFEPEGSVGTAHPMLVQAVADDGRWVLA